MWLVKKLPHIFTDFGTSMFFIAFSLSTPGKIPSGVSLKPRHCTFVASNSHFGSFGVLVFNPTFSESEEFAFLVGLGYLADTSNCPCPGIENTVRYPDSSSSGICQKTCLRFKVENVVDPALPISPVHLLNVFIEYMSSWPAALSSLKS